jgi:hypothetical protein
MSGIIIKQRQFSLRVSEELTVAIEHLEKTLAKGRLPLSYLFRVSAENAIKSEVERLYKLNNIPLPDIPKTKEEKALAYMKATFPEASEEKCLSILEQLKRTRWTP